MASHRNVGLGDDVPAQTRSLLEHLEERREALCDECGAALCGHQVLMSLACGYRDSPSCPACLAGILDRPAEGLARGIYAFLQSRECYRTAWLRASEVEGIGAAEALACLRSSGETGGAGGAGGGQGARPAGGGSGDPGGAGGAGGGPPEEAAWDAGDMGCGELLLELRVRLGGLRPGQVLTLRALDPGAREDIPSWCRLTGHALVRAEHPHYSIRRKES